MNVEIAERLAKRRREAGYSQESLAEQLGVSRQAVSKWERSESSPDTDNLIALAQLYGVSLDELLYVDESIKEDVAFEATDRAEKVGPSSIPDESESSQDEKESEEPKQEYVKKKVNVGMGGIHVLDGDDYVHVSWRDGVHVKDSKQGEEVHVGWDGVHVKEKKAEAGQKEEEPERKDSEWEKAHVFVNGKAYEWDDALNTFKHHHETKTWLKFPLPLFILLIYILVGIFMDAWGIGLFLFLLIPVYYMLGNAITKRKPSQFFAGIYPLAAVAWFLYMAFVLNQPHPAWVIFLTIPIYEWIVFACSRAMKRSKKES